MPDKAAEQSDIILARLERDLNSIYAASAKKIRKISVPFVEEMYLDDETATQKQRLDYAKKHGLNKLIKKLTPIILDANQLAIARINNTTAIVYAINHDYAVDDMEKQAGRKLGIERYDAT